MRQEEIEVLMDEHLQLRKKEILAGLSAEEKRKLARIMSELDAALSTKKNAVSTEASQAFMSVKVVAVRNYKIEEHQVKQSFFEKLKKKEQSFYYQLIAREEDLQSDYYDHDFALSLMDLMKENGLGNQWNQILPPAIDTSMFHDFTLNKEEVDWIKELPDPSWCLEHVSRIQDLEEKAMEKNGEDLYDAVTWLKHHWSEGYQIYIDYSELGWLHIR